MKLNEMLKMCADEQLVLVIVQKDFPRPAIRGEAVGLGEYLSEDILKAPVCGVGTADGEVLKIWVEGA